MRKICRPKLLLFLALVGAAICVILVARRPSSEAERLERVALNAQRKRVLLNHLVARVAPSLYRNRGMRASWRYEDTVRQNQSNLLSMGYLEKRSFQFHNGTGAWRAFDAAVCRTLGWRELWECSYHTPETSVVIVARSSRMAELQRLVGEYDKPKPQ